jgi:predicted molibdopterin-dependent oxidoreductase YjgC
VVERIRGGGVDGLVVLGHDLLDPAYACDTEMLAKLDTLILIDTHHSDLERVAHVVMPGRHVAEKTGTLTNWEGRVQRIEPAVEPEGEAYDEGASVARLASAMGLEILGSEEYDVRRVSKALSESVGAFRGIHLDSLGFEGSVLESSGSVSRSPR